MPEIRQFLKKCMLPPSDRAFKKNANIKVLYAGFHRNGTGFYRAINPAMTLESEYGYSAIATCFSTITSFKGQNTAGTDINLPIKLLREADHIILGTMLAKYETIESWTENIRKLNKDVRIYMDIDDVFWFLPSPQHPLWGIYSQSQINDFFKILSILDGIISPSQHIINEIGITPRNSDNKLLPNLWNINFCYDGRASLINKPVFRKEGKPIRMVMAINETHLDGGISSVYPAIETILMNYNSSITNIGWDGSSKKTSIWENRWNTIKPLDFLSYINHIHRNNGSQEPVYDLAIIPMLESHHLFFKAKSFQKALEFISAGIPVITGNSTVYDNIPCEKRLTHDLDNNIAVLKYYLDDINAREALITAQRTALNQGFLINAENNISYIKSLFNKKSKNEKVS